MGIRDGLHAPCNKVKINDLLLGLHDELMEILFLKLALLFKTNLLLQHQSESSQPVLVLKWMTVFGIQDNLLASNLW